MPRPTRLLACLLAVGSVAHADDDPTLASLPSVFPGIGANGWAQGDLDGDGDADFVRFHYFLDIWTYIAESFAIVSLNEGNGVFAPASEYDTLVAQFTPTGIDLADTDGDGDLDLLVRPNGLRANLGDGDFDVLISTPIDDFGNISSGPVGDMDGDGLADRILVGSPPATSFDDRLPRSYLSTGEGFFAPTPIQFGLMGSIGYGSRTVLDDFDGDGDLDLAAVDADGDELVLFRGQGDGLFALPTPLADAPESVSSLSTADLDLDGHVDLLFVSSMDDDTQLYRALGDGSGGIGPFETTALLENHGVAVMDLTRDGIPDAVTAAGFPPAPVQLLAGDGRGGWLAPATSNEDTITGMAWGDFNGDGFDEVHGGTLFGFFDRYTFFGSHGPFVDVGFGTQGGALALRGWGSTEPTEEFHLRVVGASGSTALVLLSATADVIPFLFAGGQLVPGLDAGLILAVDPNLPLDARWPPGLPTGLQVYAQAFADGALSNALVMVAR